MQPTDVRSAANEAANQSKSFPSQRVDPGPAPIGRPAGALEAYVNRGADALARAAGYLTTSGGERLIGDLEDLARRRVWAVAGGALVLGFTASRLLKTSRARRPSGGRAGLGSGAGDEVSYDESTDIGGVRGGADRDAV